MISGSVVAFSDDADGDVRGDMDSRRHLSTALGLSPGWSVIDQVHGSDVVRSAGSGTRGRADAQFTTEIDLPLAVFTADCLGVALRSPGAVGVAHAGWRGTESGVVARLRAAMDSAGHPPVNAIIGPHIRSCCFEVGSEVAERFPEHTSTTTWGTLSVDLSAAVRVQLDGLDVSDIGICTHHEAGWFSHRRDADPRRMATVVVRSGD